MVLVSGTTIQISKKNSAVVDFSLLNADGSLFEPSAEDIVVFSVKKALYANDYTLQKETTPDYEGKCTFSFTAAELDLHVGRYYYDLKIFHTDGREETIINPAIFEVIEVVNND